MNLTSIEWTTFSANPLKYRDAEGRVVWGCVHKSEGCRNCYSEALAKRYGRGGPFAAHVMRGLVPFMDDRELRHMRTAQRIGGKVVSGERCFVGDMTDLFGEWVPDELLDRLFAAFAWRRDVTWQVLTKRADRMRAYSAGMAALATKDRTRRLVASMYRGHPAEYLVSGDAPDDRVGDLAWPLPNVWLGTSVEDQRTADERIAELLQTPAAVRFVSYEPAIEHVDLWPWATGHRGFGIDWIIVGGESGPSARPFDLAWARSTVAQCKAAGVPVFVKQIGAKPYDSAAVHIPVDAMLIRDRKGGSMEEWPQDLRVREFPHGEAAA